MTVYAVDTLSSFGSLETVQVPSLGIGYTNDATAKAPLGMLYRQNGCVYRYVQHTPQTAVATIADGAAYWYSLDPPNGLFKVSSDQTDSMAGVNGVAGFYIGNDSTTYIPVTATYYTWIKVGGVVNKVYINTAWNNIVAVGAKCFGYTTDLQLNWTAAATSAGTANVIATVIGSIDITNTVAAVLLQNLVW